MQFNIDLNTLLLFVTILGSLATAISTSVATRNQLKSTDSALNKDKAFVPIDISEKLTTISMTIISNLQKQLGDCEAERDELESRLKSCQDGDYASKIKLRKLLSKLRSIRERHDRVYGELKEPCDGFAIINTMVDELIVELEKELGE